MNDVKVLVLTGFGLNCDGETVYAFQHAGATAVRVHINSLVDGSINLHDFQIMVFIGGFSWGDDHGAGVIQAIRMRTQLGEQLVRFAEKGNLILGICNGFQVLVNLGLLPGFDGDYRTRCVALTYNDSGNFRNDWVRLRVNPASPCIFTKALDHVELPVRHGEGKFYADEATLDRLFEQDLVALQYARPDGTPAHREFPFNPNGSVRDIAGICDPTGRIFGLMPHPEAFNHLTNHPDWTRAKEKMKRQGYQLETGITVGIQMLKNGVAFVRKN
jgi:phosphoribosylformylglycinamidine synthase